MNAIHGSLPQETITGAVDFGLPPNRLTLGAARQAFMQLKQSYLQALDAAPGRGVDGLREQVWGAEELADLWRLRSVVFDALPAQGACTARATLKRNFDLSFPLSDLPSVFGCN